MNRKTTAGVALAITLGLSGAAQAQNSGGSDLFGALRSIFGGGGDASSTDAISAALSATDADAALREALELGARHAAAQLGQTDGFFADPQVKIPLPDRLEATRSALSRIGMSGPLDNLELSMNRAAEAAAPEAADIVVEAVRSMTVEDAIGLVRGGDNAATNYLRAKTEPAIAARFAPIINQHLEEAGAIAAFDAAASRARLDGAADEMKGRFTDEVVSAALDGVFFYLAEEEAAIRRDPAGQASDLLRRVFGG